MNFHVWSGGLPSQQGAQGTGGEAGGRFRDTSHCHLEQLTSHSVCTLLVSPSSRSSCAEVTAAHVLSSSTGGDGFQAKGLCGAAGLSAEVTAAQDRWSRLTPRATARPCGRALRPGHLAQWWRLPGCSCVRCRAGHGGRSRGGFC